MSRKSEGVDSETLFCLRCCDTRNDIDKSSETLHLCYHLMTIKQEKDLISKVDSIIKNYRREQNSGSEI